jgi:hypothetical protein
MPKLVVTEGQHASALNTLAEEGAITPVVFTDPDGVRHEANSVWAACDWLKANGFYKQPCAPTIWEF